MDIRSTSKRARISRMERYCRFRMKECLSEVIWTAMVACLPPSISSIRGLPKNSWGKYKEYLKQAKLVLRMNCDSLALRYQIHFELILKSYLN